MGDGCHPNLVPEIDVDQRVWEPVQRAVAHPFLVLRIQLRVLTYTTKRSLKLHAKLSAQANPLLLIALKSLAEFGLGCLMNGEGLQG